MTVTVHIATVATSIAALSISGVTIKDISGIPANANLQPATLYPNPDNWIDGIKIEAQTFGIAGVEKQQLDYDLHYRYIHCAPGAVGAFDYYPSLVSAIATIMQVICINDTVTGAQDFRLKSMSAPKIVTDPAGNSFWGCDFTFHVIEFLEVP
jgi:hypothetical protein